MFLIFAVATLGVGSVVAIPLIILVAIWQIYRLVKGIFRLSDGRPMGDKAIAIGAVAEVSELEREIAASTRGNKSTPPPLPGS
jgi:hypothetical protein